MILVILLPAMAYGHITVYLDVTTQPPLIDVSGSSSILISEKEQIAFKLDDANLKKSVAVYSEATPTDVMVRNDWRNLYESNVDWKQVKRSVKPTLLTRTDVQVSNQCVPVPLHLDADLKVSNIWENTTIPTDERIEYEIVYETGNFKFNSSWGKMIDEVHSYTLPGAKTSVKKCVATVNLVYEATLWGDVAANYADMRNGSHFWKFDVNNVQTVGGVPTSILHRETLTVSYIS